jgi:hypothetical protein
MNTCCHQCGKECNEKAIYLRVGIFEVSGNVFIFCSSNCLLQFAIYELEGIVAHETVKEGKEDESKRTQ